MAGCFGVIGCLVVIAVAVMGAATAETNTVGDSLGWKVPPGGAIAYSTWANKQTFEVGDALVFNWTGTQDVARVPKDQFNNCTTNFVFGTTQTTSPANFTLESNVTYYHICTIDSHCSSGQKLEITTGSNGASPLAAGAFSVVLLALAVSLMSHM